ncbi:hypothetical protein TrST_g13314 [Triparma strigata]|uniref:EF-hand domain-containing protein n=1 Tax=Triparma strigata TaxID=1606541 RepID=A0A9W6ZV93_9STRA|nr:hypothetical protein TrST_g13314 [Triparma strigata]
MSTRSRLGSSSSPPATPGIDVSTLSAEIDFTPQFKLNLPSLNATTTRKPKKTANQRVQEILQEAESDAKKSAHFWDDPRRIVKAQRLAKLYNGNIGDGHIRKSVEKRTDDEVPDKGFVGGYRNGLNLFGEEAQTQKTRVRDKINFTRRDLEVAHEKLKHAAERFDEHTSRRLKSFDEKEIFADDLQDLLFRIFLVKTTLPECAALIHDFDADDSGSVDYGEFLTSFFRLSVEHKQELSLEADYTSHKVRDKMKAKEKKAIEKFAKSQNVVVKQNYGLRDLHSGLDKIAIKSALYDRARGIPMSQFDSRQMDPTGFKQQLLRMFGIRVNLRELGALFEYFDRDSSGLIDMTEFLISFFQLAGRGEEARERMRQQKENGGRPVTPPEPVANNDNKAAQKAMSKIRAMANSGDTPFNLKDAFDHFDRDGSGSVNHDELKSVVKEICGGELTSKEIQCVIELFDPNNDGEIAYDEFAYSFYNRRGVTKDNVDLNLVRVVENIKRREQEEGQREEGEMAMMQAMEASKRHKNPPIVMTKELIKLASHVMDQVRQRTAKMSLKEAFNHFDTDNSGSISHDELTVAIREVSGKKLRAAENDAIIAMFDPNNDGSVAYDEFCWTFYNRREAVRKMEHLMNMQQAAKRVDGKRGKVILEKMQKMEERNAEYLPDIHFQPTDGPSTKTAKIASTLINSLQKSKQRIRHSSLKQSRSCTLIRCTTPEADKKTGQAIATLGREFKAKVLKYDMKWVALKELTALLYRRSIRGSHFIELMHKDTFNGGFISRKDFSLMMVESLSDLHVQSHNRIYSCFDPDHDDCVFIGELAVAIEAISCTNSTKMMCDVFQTLVYCSQFEEEVPEEEQGSLKSKEHEQELKRQSTMRTLDYEKMVLSFITLCLKDEDAARIAHAFRDAWEAHGFGKPAPLLVRREQTITWGGKYQSLGFEDYKRVVCTSPKLTSLIEELCDGIQKIARGAAKTFGATNAKSSNPGIVKDKKTGRMRRKTNRKKQRRRAATSFHMEDFQVHGNHAERPRKDSSGM